MGGVESVNKAAVDMNGKQAELVKQKIEENCVMIFSKSYCPYCKMAKKAFDQIGAPYEVIELDKHSDGTAMQDILDTMTGARTVPRVFVGGKCIGGGQETSVLLKSGKLAEMVQQCSS